MEELETQPVETPLAKWVFEHHGPHHWEELRTGNIDKSLCWVELTDCEDGPKIDIFTDRKRVGTISTYRDQWGTYISFVAGDGEDTKGFTIAQEDGTASFMDAFIAALNEIKPICNIQTKTPERIDLTTT